MPYIPAPTFLLAEARIGRDDRRIHRAGARLSEKRLRVGLAGAGALARQFHLRALRSDPRVDLVAVAEPASAARAALPEPAGVDLLEDAGSLIARPDIEAIVVCTSTPTHAEIAAAVAAGRKHLYLEKPIALDLDEARALESAQAARDAVGAVGFNYRLSPAFRELRERVVGGEVGVVTSVRGWHCESARPETMPEWRRSRSTGGGVLLDLGSHSVDFARWLLDEEVEEVESGEIASKLSEHDDGRVILRMRSGARVELVVSYVQGRKHRWEVEGSSGILRAERWPARTSRPWRPSARGPSRLATRLRAVPIPRREPSFESALGDFVAAALGADLELPTIGDGRRSLEIVLAAERLAMGVGGGLSV